MTDRALRRWLAPLVPALLLVAACSQPVTGTPQAASGGDRPSTESSSTEDEPSIEPDPDESTSSDPDAGTAAGLEPLVGTWEGQYICGQGATGVTFTVVPVDDKTVRAVFEFFPLPENPEAKAGSYQLLGTYRGDRLVFEQEKWIDQPENYVMVDLEVTSPVVASMKTINGTMLSSSCEDFTVTRTG